MRILVTNQLNEPLIHLKVLYKKPEKITFYFLNKSDIFLNAVGISNIFTVSTNVYSQNAGNCTNLPVKNVECLVKYMFPEDKVKLAVVRGWSLARLYETCTNNT